MKSSLRPASDPSLQATIPVWAPVELVSKPVEPLAGRAEEMLAVLSPNRTNHPSRPGASLTDSIESSAATWRPKKLRPEESPSFGLIWKHLENSTPEQMSLKQEAEQAAAIILEQANREAAEILRAAEAKAAEIVRLAQDEADEMTLQAHQQGWNTAEAETAEMIRTVQEIVHQTEAWHAELLAQSENTVLELVRDMARVMFGEGFVLNGSTLQECFNRLLTNARSLGDLRIYVNPEDAASLDPYWREFQVSISGHQVQIIPSDTIRRGGCFIDGQWGSIDARIETQLKAILDTLSESNSAAGGESESSAD